MCLHVFIVQESEKGCRLERNSWLLCLRLRGADVLRALSHCSRRRMGPERVSCVAVVLGSYAAPGPDYNILFLCSIF